VWSYHESFLFVVVDVPEGSGPFAHVLAQAGITRDMFESVGTN
jgi:hypothetical protein